MKIMGLDLGTKTVGVAISDALLITAQPVETITRKQPDKLRQTLARIEQLIEDNGVEKIILGYPKNMNDTVGERALFSEEFKEKLERRTGLEVILWDERLTTVAATEVLDESNVPRSEQKKYVDQIAASLILQEHLDSIRN